MHISQQQAPAASWRGFGSDGLNVVFNYLFPLAALFGMLWATARWTETVWHTYITPPVYRQGPGSAHFSHVHSGAPSRVVSGGGFGSRGGSAVTAVPHTVSQLHGAASAPGEVLVVHHSNSQRLTPEHRAASMGMSLGLALAAGVVPVREFGPAQQEVELTVNQTYAGPEQHVDDDLASTLGGGFATVLPLPPSAASQQLQASISRVNSTMSRMPSIVERPDLPSVLPAAGLTLSDLRPLSTSFHGAAQTSAPGYHDGDAEAPSGGDDGGDAITGPATAADFDDGAVQAVGKPLSPIASVGLASLKSASLKPAQSTAMHSEYNEGAMPSRNSALFGAPSASAAAADTSHLPPLDCCSTASSMIEVTVDAHHDDHDVGGEQTATPVTVPVESSPAVAVAASTDGQEAAMQVKDGWATETLQSATSKGPPVRRTSSQPGSGRTSRAGSLTYGRMPPVMVSKRRSQSGSGAAAMMGDKSRGGGAATPPRRMSSRGSSGGGASKPQWR